MAGPAKFPLQTKFWKSFGRYGIFLGTVVGYSDDGVYQCYYEGDGDEENLMEEEIEGWLKRYPSVAKKNQGDSNKKKMSEEQPIKKRAKKPTTEKKQSRKGPPKVAAAKKKRLEEIWKENFQKLKSFREANGHTRVPQGWSKDPHLANWVPKQRQKHKEGKLQPHRQALLEQEGFDFLPQKRSWEESFNLLLEFKKIHGHTNVSQGHEDQKLASFVHLKRAQYRTNRIPQCQRGELEKIGFQFRLRETPKKCSFEEHYESLLEFKEAFGHVNVSMSLDKSLGQWVRSVRCGNTKLNDTQKRKLDDIGFEWRRHRTWQESFDALLCYKKKHDNCRVPFYKKDTALGYWVSKHKQPKFYNALDPGKKDQLKAIGFHPRQEATKSTNSLESNPTAHHGSKGKKSKAVTKTTSNQAAYQLSNLATRSNRNAKQMARGKIENHVDQESSEEESMSDADSYDLDGSSALEESSTTLDDSTLSMEDDAASQNSAERETNNQPDQVIIAQRLATATCSELEVAPEKPESSRPPDPSMGAARRVWNASCVAPDLARSATTATVPRPATPHRRTRSKAAAQAVPDSARSEPSGEPVVPDATESRSTCAPPARTSSRSRDQKKAQQEKLEPNQKKPRWLFD